VIDLEALAAAVRAHPGVRNKTPIGMVTDVLGASDWVTGPGDDGAVLAAPDGPIVVGGEAIAPAFVERDPRGAGIAAVVANVNDLAAMGARPLALVDAIVAPEPAARAVLEGMRDASRWYDVPVVGGHLTLHDGPPAVSAFGVGRARKLLSVRNAAAGQRLVVAAVTDGTLRDDFPFFRSFAERTDRLADDVRTLAAVAEVGSSVAAKDVSMAGVVGSAAMLVEPGRLGVTIDVDALPRPAAVDLATWLVAFPTFAFLLCAPPGRDDECTAAFHTRGIEAAVVGELDDSGIVALAARGQTRAVPVLDVRSSPVTGLARP
jgi:selenophosphate synthetase-related protein